MRNGVPRAGRCHQVVLYEGEPAAELTATSTLLTPTQLAGVRRLQRGDDPPWSHALAERTSLGVAEPACVGRQIATNVVIANLFVDESRAEANVAPTMSNRALFDHSYDHVTMQVLGEAARQLTNALTGHLEGWCMTRLQGKFMRFAELDSPVSMCATAIRGDGSIVSTVTATQSGCKVSQFTLTYERTL